VLSSCAGKERSDTDEDLIELTGVNGGEVLDVKIDAAPSCSWTSLTDDGVLIGGRS
jgi:hypothetical protein